MILRSIKVSGVGCFADPCSISDLSDGLNIIYGPNGCGKSTLMTAIARALFDGHKVGGGRIKQLVSWGRKLSPTIELEFEHEGTRYQLNKTFVAEVSAALSRFEDGRFTALARGAEADTAVRDMMSATASARGAGDVSNWGIAQILFAQQHGIALPALSGNIAQRIRQSFTDQVTDDEGSMLAGLIAKQYDTVFTSSGKYKTGKNAPPITDLQSQRDELIARREELVNALATYERFSSDIVDLDETIKQYDRQLENLESSRKEAVQSAENYKALLVKRDKESAGVETAEEKYHSLERRIEQLARERNETAESDKRIASLQSEKKLNDTEVGRRETSSKETAAALVQIENRKGQITTLMQKAEAAVRLTEQTQTAQRLTRDIERIEEAITQRDAAQRRRCELVAPSVGDIRAIRDAIRKRDTAMAQLDSAMLHVKIHPDAGLSLDVLQGENAGERSPATGEELHLSGSPAIEFTIEGVGRFEVTGPAVSVEQLRGQCERIDAQITELTEPYGRRDLDELEQLHQRGLEFDRQTEEADKLVAERLDGRNLDTIRADLSRATQTAEEIRRAYPDWTEDDVSPQKLREEAESARRDWDSAMAEARRQADAARTEHQSAVSRQQILAERLENERRTATAAAERIASLTDDGLDDEARRKQLDDLAIAHRAARAELEKADAELARFEGDPLELAATLGRQADRTREQIQRAKNDQSERRGRLREIADSSPYGELAQVEERIESLDRQITDEENRYQAIRLLHQTVQANMREISNLVVEPIEERSRKILRRILGQRLGTLRLDENFQPEGLVPPNLEETVGVDRISGGEREQVEFAIRMALAQILAESDPTGRQTMVLDDVLTMSDTARFARILRLLEEAAGSLQILIFTCHPERYGGLEDAKMFDLERLKLAGTSSEKNIRTSNR